MRKVGWLLLAWILSVSLLGCAKDSGAEAIVYRVNPEGNGLEQIKQEQMELDALIEGVGQPSEQVEIQTYNLDKGVLEVVFSEAYNDLSTSYEVLYRAAFVQTVCQLPAVSYVEFYAGEKEITDLSDQPIGYMKADDFVQNVGSSLKAYQSTGLTLYFANEKGTALYPERRTNVHYTANTSLEKLVVDRLMKGTSSTERRATIASTVQLIGVTVRDGICYVNFNSAFLTEGYDQAPEVVIYSIVNSIVSNGTVSYVQILVDGSSDVVYKGTVDLSKPLTWNGELVGE